MELYSTYIETDMFDEVVDFYNLPDNFVSLRVYFKYSCFEIYIGTMKVISFMVDAMNDVRHEGPTPQIQDHKWCEQIMKIVCEAMAEIF